MAKDLEYYLAQARRIAEHREAGAEKAIRKEFRELLKSLKSYIADVHEQYAADDGSLSYADLQKAGYDARFLEEIESRISVATPKVARELHQLVNDTYELSYKSMVEGVDKVLAGAGIDDVFSNAVAITPEQIMKVVKNPIMEVALEKNHRDIVYDIKQAVAVGLMNGDRYATVARKISVALDKENGPYKNAMRIARTEAHRVREAGNMDAAQSVDKEMQGTSTGLRMVKTWRTMKDERVRPQSRRRSKKGGWTSKMGNGPNHMKLEGQTVLADEPFDLLDGNKADAPGQSGVAGHDINCRCYVSYDMMTDEKFFNKTGRHFPGWKKHGNVTEAIEKSGENGIMEKPDIPILYAVGASGKNYPVKLPNGNHTKLAPGTIITKVKVFAGKGTDTPIRQAKVLSELYKNYNVKPSEWQKVRGDAYVMLDGDKKHAEIHWYESGDLRVEMKVKRFFEDES